MIRRYTLDLVAAGLVVTGLMFAMGAPPDRLQGDVQRLMYVHVPAAWVAYLAFAVTLVGSVGWLISRRSRWDRLAASSAEAGVIFTGLAIALGSLWGKPIWGVWWTWDARLVTTALLFIVYLGYLALRRSVTDPETRARRSAILGVVAFVQVPIVHMSVVWWRTLHQPPTVLRPDQHPTMDHDMLIALLVNVAAFTAVYAALVRRRTAIARLEAQADAQTDRQVPLAGDAVSAPRLEGAVDG